ncbi:MAG TPA: AzlD domain-containing protein [Dongiaceae bacterium]|nr:AzlD domain-containing protein [Dongiaceae bacterium]
MKAEIPQATIWIVIVGMAVLNYAVRFIPLALVSRIDLPRPVARWLTFVPIAVMGALVASEVLKPGGTWSNPLTGPSLYAAILTAVVFRYTRSFVGATVAGMADGDPARWVAIAALTALPVLSARWREEFARRATPRR